MLVEGSDLHPPARFVKSYRNHCCLLRGYCINRDTSLGCAADIFTLETHIRPPNSYMFHDKYGLYIIFHSVVAVMEVPKEASGTCHLRDAQAINGSRLLSGFGSNIAANVEGNALRLWKWRVALRGQRMVVRRRRLRAH